MTHVNPARPRIDKTGAPQLPEIRHGQIDESRCRARVRRTAAHRGRPDPDAGPRTDPRQHPGLRVCHTDLHAADGDWPVKPRLPFIPGHEGVGFVAAVGEGVTAVKEGDRVGVPWLYTACGHCEHCLGGWETLCHDQQNTGYLSTAATPNTCWPTPTMSATCRRRSVFEEIAPILCAGVTVYKGIRMTDTRPGQWIAISGIGGLGHVAVQYAVAMGLHVVAVDVAPRSWRWRANWAPG